MPIEINEIAIQLKVRDEASAASGSPSVTGGEGMSEPEREAIVADCVSRVLRALKAQRER